MLTDSSEEASDPGWNLEFNEDEEDLLYSYREIVSHRFEKGELYYLCRTSSGQEWFHAREFGDEKGRACVNSYWDQANSTFYTEEDLEGAPGNRKESFVVKQDLKGNDQVFYLADCEFGSDVLLEKHQISFEQRNNYWERIICDPDNWSK